MSTSRGACDRSVASQLRNRLAQLSVGAVLTEVHGRLASVTCNYWTPVHGQGNDPAYYATATEVGPGSDDERGTTRADEETQALIDRISWSPWDVPEQMTRVPNTFYPVGYGNRVVNLPVYRSDRGRLAAYGGSDQVWYEVENEDWLIRPPQEPPAGEAH